MEVSVNIQSDTYDYYSVWIFAKVKWTRLSYPIKDNVSGAINIYEPRCLYLLHVKHSKFINFADEMRFLRLLINSKRFS